jgi:manganese/iron transport system ATP-binding protein
VIAPSLVPSIEVSKVTVTYSNGNTALYDASFRLEQGGICALVGVNGSGKSTLFKAIVGFVQPTEGEVRISGMSVIEACRKNVVAYVPQAEEVDWTFPVLVRDVVMMGRYGHMNFLRIPRAVDREKVRQSMERVDILGLQDRQIGELSGGQKKRVFLARALAQEAGVILLDEPFTGVDVKTEISIITVLRELRASGHIILVSTHNLGSVPEFCDQVVLINRTVLAHGPTAEVFTAENLGKAFGGKLRHFRLDDAPGQNPIVLTDDERPLVLGHGGKIEEKVEE